MGGQEADSQALTEQRLALEWFERSLDQPEAKRDAWLEEHCGDAGVRERVRRLLVADSGGDSFMESPAYPLLETMLPAGSRVGAYRVDRLIAEGGMGSVYLAHRDDGVYEQEVAIKFLHPLLRAPEANRRFASERQILAQLQHPNIAQMLDAGHTDENVPYVVMEYVDGVSITEFCRRNETTLRDRLALFRKVCSAVSAAHRALIVHRDLKPGNILVTAEGRPMLLDFGIAKMLDQGIEVNRATTVMALTPAYASPEQIQRRTITTSSDIYSLGVLLYELLSGRRPYELDRLSPAQAQSVVCDTAPPLLSQSVAAAGSDLVVPVPARQLRGDLDVIVMKAMHKEPDRRYGSVQEFSEDIHRYLRGLPIHARADRVGYRVAKFVGRNRWAVVAALMVLLSLVGGILASTWQAQRAEQAALLAQAEQTKAEKINAFYKNVFMSPSSQWLSSYGKGADVSIEQVLDFAGSQVDSKLASEPALQVDVLDTLALAFQGMGVYRKALEVARRALETAQRQLPATSPLLAVAEYRVAQGYYLTTELEQAEPHYLRAISLARESMPADAEVLALMHNDLAVLYGDQHRLGEAEREQQSALDILRRRMQGKPFPAIAIGIGNLGFLRMQRGNLKGAMDAFDSAESMFAQMPDREFAEKAIVLYNRSVVHTVNGEYAQADADARQAVQIAEKQYGRDHPLLATILARRIETAVDLNEADSVAPLVQRARGINATHHNSDKPTSARVELPAAYWYLARRDFAQASKALDTVERLRRQVQVPDDRLDRVSARIWALRGELLLAQGKPAQARPLLQRAVDMERKLYGPDVAETRRFQALLDKAGEANAEEAAQGTRDPPQDG